MFDHPLVSFIVLAYKQEKFIRKAVLSALAQTYGKMEIILSDDGSPDKTFEIMEEEAKRYRGPHRVILNRNPTNLGLSGNLNAAVKVASGELLVCQGGDDISFDVRTSKIVQHWVEKFPRPDLIFSDVTSITEDGTILKERKGAIPITTLEELIRGKWFIAGGCAAAYSMTLFKKYGPLHPDIQFEDYVLTFRALLGNGCAYIDEPLVYYRIHNGSIMQSPENKITTRHAQAKRAKQTLAQEEDRLRVWDISEKKDKSLRRQLVRNLIHAKLHARSSRGSKFSALECVVHALVTARPRTAWKLFRRDILFFDG